MLVINYEILKYWLKWIQQHKPNTVIFDECQYLINRRSGRTKASNLLAKQCAHRIGLSATPLLNRPAELWPTLNIIRPDLYASFFKYGVKYCDPKLTNWGWEYKGATNIPELHEELTGNLMIRRHKNDVLKDLPDKVRQVKVIPMDNLEEYEEANTNFLDWLAQARPSRVASANRAAELAKLSYLLKLIGKGKLKGVVEWVNNWLYDTDEKIVVLARHRAMIKALDRRIEGSHAVITGDVTGRKRQIAIDRFTNDRTCRVLIGNIHAAGVGTNLQMASTVAFAELWWRPGDHLQGEGRIERIGQTQKMFVYYLCAAHTLDETLAKLIQEKQEIITSTLDGNDFQLDQLDVFDQLIKEIRR
jgi:SWI/SNF-related matrix-associated actin-dependent regulator of chromatin subfamily A-like protein 1